MILVANDVSEPKFRKQKIMYGVEVKKNTQLIGRFEDPPACFEYLVTKCGLPINLFKSKGSIHTNISKLIELNKISIVPVLSWEHADMRFAWDGDFYEMEFFRKDVGI